MIMGEVRGRLRGRNAGRMAQAQYEQGKFMEWQNYLALNW